MCFGFRVCWLRNLRKFAGKQHSRYFCWEKEKVVNWSSLMTALYTGDLLTKIWFETVSYHYVCCFRGLLRIPYVWSLFKLTLLEIWTLRVPDDAHEVITCKKRTNVLCPPFLRLRVQTNMESSIVLNLLLLVKTTLVFYSCVQHCCRLLKGVIDNDNDNVLFSSYWSLYWILNSQISVVFLVSFS